MGLRKSSYRHGHMPSHVVLRRLPGFPLQMPSCSASLQSGTAVSMRTEEEIYTLSSSNLKIRFIMENRSDEDVLGDYYFHLEKLIPLGTRFLFLLYYSFHIPFANKCKYFFYSPFIFQRNSPFDFFCQFPPPNYPFFRGEKGKKTPLLSYFVYMVYIL